MFPFAHFLNQFKLYLLVDLYAGILSLPRLINFPTLKNNLYFCTFEVK